MHSSAPFGNATTTNARTRVPENCIEYHAVNTLGKKVYVCCKKAYPKHWKIESIPPSLEIGTQPFMKGQNRDPKQLYEILRVSRGKNQNLPTV